MKLLATLPLLILVNAQPVAADPPTHPPSDFVADSLPGLLDEHESNLLTGRAHMQGAHPFVTKTWVLAERIEDCRRASGFARATDSRQASGTGPMPRGRRGDGS